ncbi:DUF1801 domain-containing protein [Lutimonas vermicola]|uniref:DUF1801 domain-containing protein n=1 Tax=Lutimonas vermicola TaxID=414288 RepID=A0ABU9KYD5_9FLAO
MSFTPSSEVQEFLKKLSTISHEHYELVSELRRRTVRINSNVSERMMYGGIMFSVQGDVGGVFTYKNHVTFEFGNGYLFKDPDHTLEGKGKYRRHLKFESFEDLLKSNIDFYIKQMFTAGS